MLMSASKASCRIISIIFSVMSAKRMTDEEDGLDSLSSTGPSDGSQIVELDAEIGQFTRPRGAHPAQLPQRDGQRQRPRDADDILLKWRCKA